MIILFPGITSVAQVDSVLAKRLSISGFFLCQTSLTSLKKTAVDLKMMEVEEMDYPKNCYGHDSRYTGGTGYSSAKYPGLIFQVGDESDYIGKIRLTKEFNGRLPDGKTIELGKLKLKDLFQLYPEFKDQWHSRDCSDYWRFSNDTIEFFVKIDKSIQPQFPINETYYLDKPVEAADFVVSCYSFFHKKETINLFNEEDPLFFMDSIRVNRGVLNLYNPEEIAYMTVYKDENAIKVAGKEAKNGAIYIFTKEYARASYWEYFSSKSQDYKRLVPDLEKEKSVAYFLNGKKRDKDYEGDLFEINDDAFIELTVENKKNRKGTIIVNIRTKQN